jgi:hypothetical protein
MFSHVVNFKAPAEKLETVGMQGFRERVVPVLNDLPGYKGSLILLDRVQGELLGFTLWDTEEQARTADTRLEQERQTGMEQMGATSAANIYEVLVQTMLPPSS